MLPYAISIFTGAFLLFQVQPLIGKYILPWFGGSPGVWTTCLLFFQTLLLGGYAYAHVSSTRLKPRTQMIVHVALLALSLVFLPITPSESWKLQEGGNPAWRILLLLSATVGVPYLVLSATGPLLQHWFSRTHPDRSPYRLYALSNFGSLLALLSYPFFFEPRLTRHDQVLLWSAGLVVFSAVCAYCAILAGRRPLSAPPVSVETEPVPDRADATGWKEKALWVTFPAVASVLLLAVTNKLSQDVAVIPFLWVLPLSLYLLSFILCFDHPRWYSRGAYAAALVVAVGGIGSLLAEGNSVRLWIQVAGYSAALFVACMICHGELYRLRPSSARLTQYYLAISAGGALGGFLVAIVAPLVLNQLLELQFGLWVLVYLVGLVCLRAKSRALALGTVLGTLLAVPVMLAISASTTARTVGWSVALRSETREMIAQHGVFGFGVITAVLLFAFGGKPSWPREWRMRQAGAPLFLPMAVAVAFLIQARGDSAALVEAVRNFYGTLSVAERNTDSGDLRYYALTHGTITHGIQFAESPQTKLPTTYYGLHSGVGLAVLNSLSLGGRRVGIVGLGTGTIAAYGAAGDKFRFYDINPAVEHLARTRFKYLEESAAEVTVVLGDARISMEKELSEGELQQFDVLALDAFSSDAIPVHLLTREAFELYLKHLAWSGVIAVHISNRYLDLEPVVYKAARSLGLQAVTISDNPPKEDWWLYRSTWVLVSRTTEPFSQTDIAKVAELPLKQKDVRLWTDDYASLLPVLR
ncbi:ferrichrome ABC transporter permease [Opitutaceae bacterium EW11]|nr:ferrichrome ABC transporter permease [Opitutaceae bacterium EW11]